MNEGVIILNKSGESGKENALFENDRRDDEIRIGIKIKIMMRIDGKLMESIRN